MRLFFALWPPPEAARRLAAWAREAARLSGGRATRERTIHLTLAFLGEADPGLAAAAARGAPVESFVLPIDTARYWRHNRIVWAGPAHVPVELEALSSRLQSALRGAGFRLEERDFAAHVTLVRKADAPGNLPELPQLDWPVREFVLVRSALSREGPAYEALERFPLGGGR